MPKREDVLQQMIASLTISDKEWDIQPGSPEYKILEAVAQQIESISYNATLNDYHFDVDSKVGLELDMFMALFGFARIRGKRATGQVTFGMKSAATQDYTIPRGTQVAVQSTAQSPAIYYTTTTEAILAQGQREISVPIQATLAGTSGNVPAGAISLMASSVGAISYVYNANDIAGGRAAESDFDLRDRWRRTVFRNMSGTEDQFLGVAYNESAFVKRANLIGPVERYLEQIQLIPPMNMVGNVYPWSAENVETFADGRIMFDETDGINDVFRFGEPETDVNQIWLGIYAGDPADNLMGIYLVDSTIVVADETVGLQVVLPAGEDLDPTCQYASCTVAQLFLSYNNDIQYAFPAGGQSVTYNTSGTNFINTAVPSTEIKSQILDYYYGTYAHLDGTGAQNFSAYLDAINDEGYLEPNQVPPAIGPYLFVTPKGAQKMGYDSVIDLEYEYTPASSRNVPTTNGGIVNKIDIFTDGTDGQRVTEQIAYPDSTGDKADNINKFGNAALPAANFVRDSGIPPKEGNVFTPLAKQPIVYPPESITATTGSGTTQRSNTYYLDEDFWFVKRVGDKLEGSPRAISGIEWKCTTENVPSAGSYDGSTSTDFHVVAGSSGVTGGLNPDSDNTAYAYVFTWVDGDGTESLPCPAFVDAGAEVHSSAIVLSGVDNIEVHVPSITACGGNPATDFIRRIYRTKGIDGTAEEARDLANAGEAFFVASVSSPDAKSFLDVKSDSELSTIRTPPAPLPPEDTPIQIEYTYNKLTERLDKSVELVRLVGMDTLVHEATPRNLKINLALVPAYTSNIESLRNEISDMFTTWTERKRFMGNVQVADIIGLMENIPSIDNVRLASIFEAENDLQIIKIWNDNAAAAAAAPSGTVSSSSSDNEIWFELDGYTTEHLRWDAIYDSRNSRYDVNFIRHLFEDLPNIQPGLENAFTLETQMDALNATLADKTMTVNETNADPAWAFLEPNTTDHSGFVDGLWNGFNMEYLSPDPSNPDYDGYYLRVLQVDNEIMLVNGIKSASRQMYVGRAVFDSKLEEHAVGANVHILGDIVVALRNEGLSPTGVEKGQAFEIQLMFIPNIVTTERAGNAANIPITNRWGYKYVNLITPFTGGAASVTVDKGVNGCGFGIDTLADDTFTILGLPTFEDVYMTNDELPFIQEVSLVFRARNTF